MAFQLAELRVSSFDGQKQEVRENVPLGLDILAEVYFLPRDSNEAIEDEVGIELDPHDRVDLLLMDVLEAEKAVISQGNVFILQVELYNLALPKLLGDLPIDDSAISTDFD